jgi:hypothetical protein
MFVCVLCVVLWCLLLIAVVYKYFKRTIEWSVSTFDSLNLTLILQLVVVCAYISNFHFYCYSVHEYCVVLIIHICSNYCRYYVYYYYHCCY